VRNIHIVILMDLWQAPTAFYQAPTHAFPPGSDFVSTLEHRVSMEQSPKPAYRHSVNISPQKAPWLEMLVSIPVQQIIWLTKLFYVL